MTYVVEIEDKDGHRALKEYEANSPYELVGVVRYELNSCPSSGRSEPGTRDSPRKSCTWLKLNVHASTSGMRRPVFRRVA